MTKTNPPLCQSGRAAGDFKMCQFQLEGDRNVKGS